MTGIGFWKLHGVGNDFIAIDERDSRTGDDEYSDFAGTVCHRRFSVGADGLLVVKNSEIADVKMVYYNSDSTRGEMCGNGLRCFSKFVRDNKIVDKKIFTVETLDGIKTVETIEEGIKTSRFKIDMGKGSFKTDDFHGDKSLAGDEIWGVNQVMDGMDFKLYSMMMGVPHTIVYRTFDKHDEILEYGNRLEHNRLYLERTNVNFVDVVDRNTIKVRTWERGCGYTYGCGTGMTASAVISNRLGLCDSKIDVISEGGKITIEVDEDTNYMTGPAEKICEGYLEV